MSDLGNALEVIIKPIIKEEIEKLDLEKQMEILMKVEAQKASRVLEVRLDGAEKGEKFTLVHKQFEDLLLMSSIEGSNVLITGGAGLSKSTAVAQAARAFGLELKTISFSPQTTQSQIFGFVDAMGIMRHSSFTDAFINGKMYLGDEQDACGANIFILFNSAIEQGYFDLPDGTQAVRHPNFRYIGTANTNLRGAKNGFMRNRQDEAAIDRFAILEWERDDTLEEKITNNADWLKVVRKARENAEQNLENVVVTPRASYKGVKYLERGADPRKVFQWLIGKGLSEDEKNILTRGITDAMFEACQQEKPKKEKPEPELQPEVQELKDKMEDIIVDVEHNNEPMDYTPEPEEVKEPEPEEPEEVEEENEFDGDWD